MHALLSASAVVPSLLLLALFYHSDRYPEPTRVVLTTFVLGVLAVAPIWGWIQLHGYVVGDSVLAPYPRGLYRAYVLAALPEEACKYAILFFYVRKQSALDEPMDGLVYGSAASLGFALLENVIYVSVGGWTVAIARATTAVPLHALLGAIMGSYIARAKFEPDHRARRLVQAFTYPLILHGAYNAPLLVMQSNPEVLSAVEAKLFVGFVYTLLIGMTIEVVWLNRRLRRLQRRGEVPE